jgi:hypothetical protein
LLLCFHSTLSAAIRRQLALLSQAIHLVLIWQQTKKSTTEAQSHRISAKSVIGFLALESPGFGSGTKSNICHQGTKIQSKPFLFLIFLVPS